MKRFSRVLASLAICLMVLLTSTVLVTTVASAHTAHVVKSLQRSDGSDALPQAFTNVTKSAFVPANTFQSVVEVKVPVGSYTVTASATANLQTGEVVTCQIAPSRQTQDKVRATSLHPDTIAVTDTVTLTDSGTIAMECETSNPSGTSVTTPTITATQANLVVHPQ